MDALAYAPKILRSMAEICDVMGVGTKTVKTWIAKGAPIALEGELNNVRYSAEAGRLQSWRETVSRAERRHVK